MDKKKKFKIAIEETIVGELIIEAEEAEEAMDIAEEKYRRCEFVLCPGEVHRKQMAIISPENEATEWIEF